MKSEENMIQIYFFFAIEVNLESLYSRGSLLSSAIEHKLGPPSLSRTMLVDLELSRTRAGTSIIASCFSTPSAIFNNKVSK